MLLAPALPKPILKWAGGKTQLLDELLIRAPKKFERYVEPFVGGGALFFALQPQRALIADSNPELINLYRQVAADPDGVFDAVAQWRNTERDFYHVRKLKWSALSPVEAAARMLFLNKTCYNGLYRVNQRGEFNVPFGRYSNPKIADVEVLRAASSVLKNAEILCADFQTTLRKAQEGDFVFLDPPYVPVSAFADFKRYTKEQFREAEHRELALEAKRLKTVGCHVVITNSDAPLVHEIYSDFERRSFDTKRHISCNGLKRFGKDVIIFPKPAERRGFRRSAGFDLSPQVAAFPPTRFMGSKSKLLADIWGATRKLQFDTVVDLFAGSGIVGYMFKCQGKQVISNDHMAMSSVIATAVIQNSQTTLDLAVARKILRPGPKIDDFVRMTFSGLYFSESDELTIDVIRSNIANLSNKYQRALAKAALIRACMKKRPRGIFTYTGMRYDDGRQDLKLSLAEHFLAAVVALNNAVFSNGTKCEAHNGDALDVTFPKGALVYVDPPYWSPLSDNEYVRRYHFVEGLARDWQGVEIQPHTKTRKFKSYATPFRTRDGTIKAFAAIMERARDNPLVISYSSNGEPDRAEIRRLLKDTKRHVEIIPVKHKYSFGNQGHKKGQVRNTVDEYLFVAW